VGITALDFESLKEWLQIRRFSDDEIKSLSELPTWQLAESLAVSHIEENKRRLDGAQSDKAWKWLHNQSSYKAFFRGITARQGQLRRKSDSECSKCKCDELNALTCAYNRLLEGRVSNGLDRLHKHHSPLKEHFDPPVIIYARACANSLPIALYGESSDATLTALLVARRAMQKAKDAISQIYATPSIEDSDLGADGERQSFLLEPRDIRAAKMLIKGMEHSARKIDMEIKVVKDLRKMHGPVREFLTRFINELGTRRCDTSSGLLRLAELVDPEILISEDTVSRLLKRARKREEAFAAYLRRKNEEPKGTANPQNSP
jgi:hypothetical protein